MQHIGMQRETEQGEMLETSSINFADILALIDEGRDGKQVFPWLSAVDPYGSTTLNQYQVPHVISELQAIKDMAELTDAMKLKIDEACAFMKKIVNAGHEHVRLTGD